jgi:hypothetical protein
MDGSSRPLESSFHRLTSLHLLQEIFSLLAAM